MQAASYNYPTRMIFGPGTRAQLGGLLPGDLDQFVKIRRRTVAVIVIVDQRLDRIEEIFRQRKMLVSHSLGLPSCAPNLLQV